MAHMLDLPSELLATIITFMVISSGDLREWARVSTVCKAIHTAAIEPHFLRWVDCDHLLAVTRPEHHHHLNGLLSRCVRIQNPTADLAMAKVVLAAGSRLWSKMRANDAIVSTIKSATTLPSSAKRNIAKYLITDSIADVPYVLYSMEDKPESRESYERLHHWRLIKSFIRLVRPMDLKKLVLRLKEFIIFVVGYPEYLESGIKNILHDMYAHVCYRLILADCRRRMTVHISYILIDMFRQDLDLDTSEYREKVILALDKLIQV